VAFLGPAVALAALSQPGISKNLAVALMTAALGITSLGVASLSLMPRLRNSFTVLPWAAAMEWPTIRKTERLEGHMIASSQSLLS
jgi:hypothetical protein